MPIANGYTFPGHTDYSRTVMGSCRNTLIEDTSTPRVPRIEWVDILKGLAILLVVVGHMEYAEGTANPGRMLIYSFHMPLFFMLAGYTAALSLSRNPNLLKFISRRFLSVMVPYICWMLASPCIYATTGRFSTTVSTTRVWVS